MENLPPSFILIFPIIMLFFYLYRLLQTKRLYVKYFRYTAFKLLKYTRNSNKRILLLNLVGLIILIPLGFITEINLYFLLFAVIMLVILFTQIAQPPAILFLANSNRKAIDLFTLFNGYVSPLRVSLFLDPKSGEEYLDLKLTLLFNNMSILERNDNSWKAMIADLVSVVPVIVMDGRKMSKCLIYEIEIIDRIGKMDDLIFFCDYPSQAYLFPQIRPENIVTSEPLLLSRLESKLRRKLPSSGGIKHYS